MGVAIGRRLPQELVCCGGLDELGRVVGAREFSNDTAGHQSLLKWAVAQG
jgi:hypothetical protein